MRIPRFTALFLLLLSLLISRIWLRADSLNCLPPHINRLVSASDKYCHDYHHG